MAKNRNRREAGLKAKATILAKKPDFYQVIGRKGRAAQTGPSGFALDRERARTAGAKGGRQRAINHRKKLSEHATISEE